MPTGTVPTVNYSPLVDESTIQNVMRGAWDNTKKKRYLFEKMDEAGNVTMDGAGPYHEQNITVGEFQKEQRADLSARTFSRKQHEITIRVPWAFNEVKDVLSDRDLAQNTGNGVKTKLIDGRLVRMGKDFEKGINFDLLNINRSGNTAFGVANNTAAELPIIGLLSVFGYGATATGYSPATGTTGSAVVDADKEVLPNSSYLGQTTLPGGLTGVDNALSEAYSPVIVNWSSTGFDNAGASSLWADNCINVIDYMNLRVSRANEAEEMPDCGLTTLDLYQGIKRKLQSIQRIAIDDTSKSPNAGMFARRMIPYENISITYDTDVVADTFQLLNSKQMWFKCLEWPDVGSATGAYKGAPNSIFKVTQQHSAEQGGHLVVVQHGGQLIVNPRYAAIAYNFA